MAGTDLVRGDSVRLSIPSKGRKLKLKTISVLALAALTAPVVVAPSAAQARTIHKTVGTQVKFSATKTADGTITARATFISSDGHCLSAKRFGGPSGRYAGSALEYGGPSSNGFPFGEDGVGYPPHYGWLFPASPAGHSPYVFQAVWPGSTVVPVDNELNHNLPGRYSSTVGAASAVSVSGATMDRNAEGRRTRETLFWKTSYRKGGDRIVLKCLRSTDAEGHPNNEGEFIGF